MLSDAHIHLQLFDEPNLSRKIMDSGVSLFVCNGTRPEDWGRVCELGAIPKVYPFFGLHPWFIKSAGDGWFEQLSCRLAETCYCGVGEIGLDRVRKGLDWDLQQEVFLKQLELAQAFRRPISIHCVRAWGRLLELLKPFLQDGLRAMVHGFTGSKEMVRELTSLGVYISITPSLFQDPEEAEALLPHIPVDRLLLETDGQGVVLLADCVERLKVFCARAERVLETTEIQAVVRRNISLFLTE